MSVVVFSPGIYINSRSINKTWIYQHFLDLSAKHLDLSTSLLDPSTNNLDLSTKVELDLSSKARPPGSIDKIQIYLDVSAKARSINKPTSSKARIIYIHQQMLDLLRNNQVPSTKARIILRGQKENPSALYTICQMETP